MLRQLTDIRIAASSLVAIAALGGLPAGAQPVPGTIHFQGRLTDNSPQQVPINAVVPMSFAIYDAQAQQNITIPANIGVTGGIWMNHTLDAYGPPGYAPLSTRDTSGTIVVQFYGLKPGLAPFYLSDFFAIWGQTYNSTCVGYGSGTYCNSNFPPVISNGFTEYCLSSVIPPIDNGKSWVIVINSRTPCTTYP